MLGNMGVDRVLNSPGLDNLFVLTSGSATGNPSEFMNLNKIKALITEMHEDYDMVLFDTPPILPVTDAVAISSSPSTADRPRVPGWAHRPERAQTCQISSRSRPGEYSWCRLDERAR